MTSQQVSGTDPVAFAYDGDGLLTQAGPLTVAREILNGRASRITSGEVNHSIAYDSFGSVSHEEYSIGSDSPFYAVTYARDDLRRVTVRTETVEGTTHITGYTRDSAGRLHEELRDGAVVATYEYDLNGNRLSRVVGATTESGTYDARDRLEAYDGYTYTYDADGRVSRRVEVTTGATLSLNYDAVGSLVGAILPDGQHITYVLDAQGRRIGRRRNGVFERGWIYQDGLRPVAEISGAGVVQSVFVYVTEFGAPDLLLRGGQVYRVLKDQVGSPRMLLESNSGAIMARWERDGFGRLLSESGPAVDWLPFGFAGGLWDRETDLIHFGAREYEVLTARWLTQEPLLFDASINLYQYANGDPVAYIDADGRNPILVGIGVAACLLAVQARYFSCIKATTAPRPPPESEGGYRDPCPPPPPRPTRAQCDNIRRIEAQLCLAGGAAAMVGLEVGPGLVLAL